MTTNAMTTNAMTNEIENEMANQMTTNEIENKITNTNTNKIADKEIIYFNKHYKTNYTKEQIEQIYWLTDFYGMTTTSAIHFCNNCHFCGDKLPVFGSEFCCNSHIFEFRLRLNIRDCVWDCAWGKSCKFCLKNGNKKEEKEEE
jgi:hypothetical protein